MALAGADEETTEEAALGALPAVRQVERADGEVRLATTDPVETVQAVLALLRAGTLRFTQLRVEEATLEDVFLHLTGRSLRE